MITVAAGLLLLIAAALFAALWWRARALLARARVVRNAAEQKQAGLAAITVTGG